MEFSINFLMYSQTVTTRHSPPVTARFSHGQWPGPFAGPGPLLTFWPAAPHPPLPRVTRPPPLATCFTPRHFFIRHNRVRTCHAKARHSSLATASFSSCNLARHSPLVPHSPLPTRQLLHSIFNRQSSIRYQEVDVKNIITLRDAAGRGAGRRGSW